jgi:hypothetical protein
MKPSGPGDFSGGVCLTAASTSSSVITASRARRVVRLWLNGVPIQHARPLGGGKQRGIEVVQRRSLLFVPGVHPVISM